MIFFGRLFFGDGRRFFVLFFVLHKRLDYGYVWLFFGIFLLFFGQSKLKKTRAVKGLAFTMRVFFVFVRGADYGTRTHTKNL